MQNEFRTLVTAIAAAAAVGLASGALLSHEFWPAHDGFYASEAGPNTNDNPLAPFGGGNLPKNGHGPLGSGRFGSGNSGNPGSGNFGSGQGSGSGSGTTSAADRALAAKVDPGLVDITTNLPDLGQGKGQAKATGVVISSSGEVLTNNHVINGATSISVRDIGNGQTYDATVVGYDRTHDIAVIQLKDASGLTTVSTDRSAVSVGDSVVGIGNAFGAGGKPAAAGGKVTALNQSITATDDTGGRGEQLSGLIQTNANIKPGDSGGPLVNSSGKVIGINTAASVNGHYHLSVSNQAFAVPIATAQQIANQIESGQGSATIHVGPTGLLGIQVDPTDQGSSGVTVASVVSGDPAAGAGIAAGDVITSINGQSVSDVSQIGAILVGLHPGDQVSLNWTDQSGGQHSGTANLASGPPA